MDFHVIETDSGTSQDINHIFDQRRYFRTVVNICPDKTVAVIDRCRFKGDHALLAGVQSCSPERNFFLKCALMNEHSVIVAPATVWRAGNELEL